MSHRTDADYRNEDAYDRLCAEVDAECRAEHEAEFDFPYVSNGKQVHQLVISKAQAMRDDAAP